MKYFKKGKVLIAIDDDLTKQGYEEITKQEYDEKKKLFFKRRKAGK